MTLRFRYASLTAGSLENMRIMRMHEALWAYGQKNLFCSGSGFTKQILEGVFGDFCLILPHMPHVFLACMTSFRIVNMLGGENMRLMREHEDRIFKGIYLFCIYIGGRPGPKYEAVMRIHEAHPHVFPHVFALQVGGGR